MKKYVKYFALIILCGMVTSAWAAGSFTARQLGYKPQLTTQGTTDYANYNTAADAVDARLGRVYYVGDPGYSTLAAAVTTISSTQATLFLPSGTHVGATTSATLTLVALHGAIISGTPAINGPFIGDLSQHFSGQPTFGAGSVKEVQAAWFPNTAAGVNQALASAGKIPVRSTQDFACETTVLLNSDQTWYINDGVTVSANLACSNPMITNIDQTGGNSNINIYALGATLDGLGSTQPSWAKPTLYLKNVTGGRIQVKATNSGAVSGTGAGTSGAIFLEGCTKMDMSESVSDDAHGFCNFYVLNGSHNTLDKWQAINGAVPDNDTSVAFNASPYGIISNGYAVNSVGSCIGMNSLHGIVNHNIVIGNSYSTTNGITIGHTGYGGIYDGAFTSAKGNTCLGWNWFGIGVQSGDKNLIEGGYYSLNGADANSENTGGGVGSFGTGTIISNVNSYLNLRHGIYVESDNHQIHEGAINNNFLSGIKAYSGSGISIEGVLSKNNGTGGVSGDVSGILVNCSGAVLKGNRCTDDAGAAGTQVYGIRDYGNGNFLEGNILYGNKTAPYLVSGGGTPNMNKNLLSSTDKLSFTVQLAAAPATSTVIANANAIDEASVIVTPLLGDAYLDLHNTVWGAGSITIYHAANASPGYVRVNIF